MSTEWSPFYSNSTRTGSAENTPASCCISVSSRVAGDGPAACFVHLFHAVVVWISSHVAAEDPSAPLHLLVVAQGPGNEQSRTLLMGTVVAFRFSCCAWCHTSNLVLSSCPKPQQHLRREGHRSKCFLCVSSFDPPPNAVRSG